MSELNLGLNINKATHNELVVELLIAEDEYNYEKIRELNKAIQKKENSLFFKVSTFFKKVIK